MSERCAKTREIRAARFSIEILDPRERKFSLPIHLFANVKLKKERERERKKEKDGGKTRARALPFRDGLMSSTVSSFLFLFDDMFLFCFLCFVSFLFLSLSPVFSQKNPKLKNPKPTQEKTRESIEKKNWKKRHTTARALRNYFFSTRAEEREREGLK